MVIKSNVNIDDTSETISASRISDSLQLFLNPNKEQKEFIASYIAYIKDNPIDPNGNNDTYLSRATVPNIIIFFLVVMFIMFFSVVKDKRKIIVGSAIFGSFSTFVFLLFYLYIYVFTFNSTILCYARYIGTVISGISVFTLLLISHMSVSIKRAPLYYFLLSMLVLLYCSSLPKVSTYVYGEKVEMETNILASEIISTLGDEANNVNVFTVYNYCDSINYSCVLHQHHLFFSLVDNGIYPLANGIYLASNGVVPPSFYIPIKFNNINSYLNDYDYVLIAEDIQNINSDSKKLFGENPKAGDFFKKIVGEDGNVSMEKIASY
jgi:hypothetical protein